MDGGVVVDDRAPLGGGAVDVQAPDATLEGRRGGELAASGKLKKGGVSSALIFALFIVHANAIVVPVVAVAVVSATAIVVAIVVHAAAPAVDIITSCSS